MEIIERSTPHKSKRTRHPTDVTMAVIHYTGSLNVEGTLAWFEQPRKDRRVSAHYVIDMDGNVYCFADHKAICWHAGRSEWAGRKHCNNFSMGYELVGNATSGFTDEQIDSLVALLCEDCRVMPINAIVGHNQIAPGRKNDPGPMFPWGYLHGIAWTNNRVTLKQLGPYEGEFPTQVGTDYRQKIEADVEGHLSSGEDVPIESQTWIEALMRQFGWIDS